MKRKVRNFALNLKEITAKGEFAGYGSVYDVIDYYNERVAPGAFASSLRKWESRGRLPPCLWQHDTRQPVGPFTKMVEDTEGLYVEGILLIDDVPKAREARALLQSKAIDGLSMGFDTIVEELDRESGLITLKEVDLWEVSIVTFQANESSTVVAIKSAWGATLPSVREFEGFLREAGFSKSHAAAVATHGLGRLLREAEGQKESDADFIIKGLAELSKPSLKPFSVEELLT